MEASINQLFQAILDGDNVQASICVKQALEEKLDPAVILNEGMVRAMGEVGRLFEEGEYFVPEMLISARAMKTSLAELKPHLVQSNIASSGKVIAGTVKGDLHDIGKNLVCMMLEGAAYEVIDLGTDVSPDQFIEAAKTNGANLVVMSALLTTTMVNMRTTVDAFKEAGIRDRVKILVGGAPVTENFAHEIGADGYASDASRAVTLARRLS